MPGFGLDLNWTCELDCQIQILIQNGYYQVLFDLISNGNFLDISWNQLVVYQGLVYKRSMLGIYYALEYKHVEIG
jgi:hypothetical protein